MALTKIINLGVSGTSGQTADKIKITNAMTLITCGLAFVYTTYYYYVLNAPIVAVLNLFFISCYALTLLFTYKKHYRTAKLWLLSIFILHIFILTTQVFTANVGFHFYYLILPSGVFLLFNEKEHLEKASIILLGGVTFFICNDWVTENPYIILSAANTQTLFSYTIMAVLIENFLVMHIFNLSIKRQAKILEMLATQDVLTGISNRRTFMEVGEELIECAQRDNKPLSLLLIDIDNFKKVNDTYGHIIGDSAIKLVAHTLDSNLRSSDCLARYGGEEFVIVLPETTLHSAQGLAENLRHKVGKLEIEVGSNQKIHNTISIGIAQFSHGETLMQLLHQADLALYQAKDLGRNRVEMHQGQLVTV